MFIGDPVRFEFALELRFIDFLDKVDENLKKAMA